MKKNFIKVSVFCALMAATSAGVVSCSDYDDDIKNHQEQIDALKKQLDASKSEITTALQTAIEGLEAEIAEVAGDANANSEAINSLKQTAAALQNAIDQKAGKDEIENLSNAVKEQIEKVNTELTAAMAGVKDELNGKVTDLTGKQNELSGKLEELNKKLEELSAAGDTEAIKAEMEQVKAQLEDVKTEMGEVAADLAAALNRLQTIEDAKYGEQIAALSTEIEELKKLEEKVNSYTDEEIKNLRADLTAEISVAIEKAVAEIDEKFATQILNLQASLDEYVKKNEMQPVLDFIGDLATVEGETLQGLLNGKVDTETYNGLVQQVADLEGNLNSTIENAITNALAQGGDINEAINSAVKAKADELSGAITDLRKTLDDMIGNTVKSFMYLPKYTIIGGEYVARALDFNALRVVRTENGIPVKRLIAENVNEVVSFRVSPISAIQAIKDGKYNLTFEGQKISRSGLTNYLDAEYLEKPELEAEGIISFKVKKGNNFAPDNAYALCAHLERVAEEDGKYNDYTDITSDFFVANHKYIDVDNIVAELTIPASNRTFVWDGSENESYDLSEGVKIIGYNDNKSVFGHWNEKNEWVSDPLTDKFAPEVFDVSYDVVYPTKPQSAPFNVDSKNGVVTLKENIGASLLGVKAYAKTTVKVKGIEGSTGVSEFNADFKNHTFEVIKAVLSCNYPAITVNWTDIMAQDKIYTLDASILADAFKMSVADVKNMVKKAKVTFDPGVFKDKQDPNDYDGSFTVNPNTGELKIKIDRGANIVGGNLVVNFQDHDDNGDGTTTTGTEYRLSVNISDVQYPGKNEIGLQKVDALWKGQDVVLTPKLTFTALGQVSGIQLSADVSSFYENLDELSRKLAQEKGASVSIDIVGRIPKGVVVGRYPGSTAERKLSVNPALYDGMPINGLTKVVFNNENNNVVWDQHDFNVSMVSLSGQISAPSAEAGKVTFKNKSEKLTVQDIIWNDFGGRTMWKSGVTQYGFASGSKFLYDPFGNRIYAMEDSKPTYSFANPNEEILQVNRDNGTITFTQTGKDLEIQNTHTATLVITVKKPKWGEIQFNGVTPKYDAQTGNYTFEYEVVVPANIPLQ